MTHVRRQIRDAVVAELQPLADRGYLVTARRVTSFAPEELPAIAVGFMNPGGGGMEQSEPTTMGSAPTIARTANLVVSAIVRDDEPYLDDTLESVAEQIEMLVSDTHAGLAKSTILETTEKEFSAIDETSVAAITLNFRVLYHTATRAPSLPL